MKSFLSDRPRITAPVVIHADAATGFTALASVAAGAHPHATVARKESAAPAGHPGGSAQVECVREGDKIARLIITCACGERIEIDCLYANAR